MIQAERARRATERVAKKQTKKQAPTKRMSLVEFIRWAWPLIFPEQKYVHGKHIELLAEHLEAITDGTFLAMGLDNRLLLNIPPGTMKSLLVTVFWPAWEWGPAGMNNLQYIATSFRDDFCIRDSRRFAQIVTSEEYQKRWPCEFTKHTETHIENSRGGNRICVPFGSLTGGRADRLLIDDPHSVEKAESDLDRARTTLRFRESATSRLNNPKTSAIIVVMQRLHQHDISGTIKQLGLNYIHVMLPMRFEKESACRTVIGEDWREEEGELLFDARFPIEVVDRDEKAMGAVATAGQHQQRPTPRGGLTFKRHWFKFVKAAPANCTWVRGWDLAASEKKGSPFTAGLKLGYDPVERHFYVGHVVRERVENPERIIVNTATQDQADHPGMIEISIPQDPGAAGKIQAKSLIGALVGHVAYATPESGDKEQRASPVAAQAEAGNIYIVEGAWNTDFMDEIETFPTGYKDQIDAFSRAFARFVLKGVAQLHKAIVGTATTSHVGDYVEGGSTRNPALGDGVGTGASGGNISGLEHLGIR